jgi:hypothetical protein
MAEFDASMISACGAYCGTCGWRAKTKCQGCLTCKGKVFWGVCEVATCALAKGFQHCGLCPSLPCATLRKYFDNPDHGDNGERLANLRSWVRGERSFTELTAKRKDK